MSENTGNRKDEAQARRRAVGVEDQPTRRYSGSAKKYGMEYEGAAFQEQAETLVDSWYSHMDEDGDGKVSGAELAKQVVAADTKLYCFDKDVNREELANLFLDMARGLDVPAFRPLELSPQRVHAFMVASENEIEISSSEELQKYISLFPKDPEEFKHYLQHDAGRKPEYIEALFSSDGVVQFLHAVAWEQAVVLSEVQKEMFPANVKEKHIDVACRAKIENMRVEELLEMIPPYSDVESPSPPNPSPTPKTPDSPQKER